MKCLQKKFEDLQDTVSSTYQKYLAVTAPPKVLVESNDIFYPELNINHKATNVRDPEPVAFETAGTIEVRVKCQLTLNLLHLTSA